MNTASYRDLQVWHKAMDFVVECYRLSERFPRTEQYGGLSTQVQRAAVSVPSNIAEGQGRGYLRDFIHRLHIAYGSLMEVETQVQIAQRLGYIETEVMNQSLAASAEIGRMLNGLINALERKLDS
jgi:four helix bundle protein